MKKVMLMIVFATLAGAGFAMDVKHESEAGKNKSGQIEWRSTDTEPETGPTDCTITVRGQLSIPGASFDIACSVTRASCEEATKAARECSRAMVSALRKEFAH